GLVGTMVLYVCGIRGQERNWVVVEIIIVRYVVLLSRLMELGLHLGIRRERYSCGTDRRSMQQLVERGKRDQPITWKRSGRRLLVSDLRRVLARPWML